MILRLRLGLSCGEFVQLSLLPMHPDPLARQTEAGYDRAVPGLQVMIPGIFCKHIRGEAIFLYLSSRQINV
jgi:hypothetical protein